MGQNKCGPDARLKSLVLIYWDPLMAVHLVLVEIFQSQSGDIATSKEMLPHVSGSACHDVCWR